MIHFSFMIGFVFFQGSFSFSHMEGRRAAVLVVVVEAAEIVKPE